MNSGMNPDERDRLTRLETKLDYVIANLSNLPISANTKAHLDGLEELVKTNSARINEHHGFIENLKLKLGIVGAGFVLSGTALTYLIKYILEHISFGWGN